MTKELEQVIRNYLGEVIHMSLGTSKDDRPWVCEVHFAYDKDLNLYFRSLTSRRHSQDIANNPKVAGNVVKQHGFGEPPFGIYFEGSAKQLGAGKEQDEAFACIDQRFQVGNKILEEAKDPAGHQFYKIIVENFYVFGKLNDQDGTQKYELKWHGNQT